MIAKDAEKAIAAHFAVPPNVQRMADRATFDLYFGPIGTEQDYEADEPYPGFSEACEVVTDWCDENLSEVWYDSDSGFVSDREPEGYQEECTDCAGSGEACFHDADSDEECATCAGSGEEWFEPTWEYYYHFEVRDVKRALFDRELCAHIN